MIEWLALILVVLMLSAALAVLWLPGHLSAVLASSAVSLILTLLFVLLRAPDVAMTEASVGLGLGSLILSLALYRLGLLKLKANAEPKP